MKDDVILCRSCRQSIYFEITDKGAKMPMTLATQEPHWIICKGAETHRKTPNKLEVPKGTQFTIKIGYRNNRLFNESFDPITLHDDIIKADTISQARSKATHALKKIQGMSKYYENMYRKIQWDNWSEAREYKPRQWITMRRSEMMDLPSTWIDPRKELEPQHPGTHGLIQITWELLQQSLFGDDT